MPGYQTLTRRIAAGALALAMLVPAPLRADTLDAMLAPLPHDPQGFSAWADLDAARKVAFTVLFTRAMELSSISRLVVAGPPVLDIGQAMALSAGEYDAEFGELYGLPFSSVVSIAGTEELPAAPVVLRLRKGTSTAGLGPALTARGFAEDRRGEITVWSRGKSGKLDLKARNRLDPFGGMLGASLRVALVGDLVYLSRTDAGIEAMLALRDAPPPTGAEAAIRAVATGDALPGALLSIQLLPRPSSAGEVIAAISGQAVTEEVRASLEASIRRAPLMPPSLGTALLDWQSGRTFGATLLLVHGDAASAALAAERLGTRIDRLESFAFKRPFAQLLDFDREIRVIGAAGLQVTALNLAHTPDDPGDSPIFRPDHPAAVLMQMIQIRDLQFLLASE